MLVQLGQRARNPDVVDLFAECHARIRKFLAMARRLAAEGKPDSEAQRVAGHIQRYFAVGFPLHLADEDELVIPTLSGYSARVDESLARMHAEHALHEPAVTRLIELCAAIERSPDEIETAREALASATETLALLLEDHLEDEERVIFPAMRLLPKTVRDQIRGSMRAKREVSMRERP